MSSSAGFSSYSSLFASGLHTSGRHEPELYAYPFQRTPHAFPDFPTNVDARRPSAADTVSSRRSSLPTTFASDRRIGQNNSYYAPRALQESSIAFTPSILLRSDTNATKRSNLKSFLSMDANDPMSVFPPLPSNLHNTSSSSPPQVSFNKRTQHARSVSASSSTWAPSMVQSPQYTSSIDNDRRNIPDVPYSSETHSKRRSHSAPLNADKQSTKSSDTPPRLEISLGPKASRISFDPSSHDATRLAAFASGVSTTQSIPARPEYEPRVRSSLPPSSSASSTSPRIPERSVKRNMSVTSATTFASATPSQRSAIRRVRRNEALARLEGNHYDPEPASASFMPFESDEEEEEGSEADRSSSNHRDTILSPARSPPPIKPPSPLRYRSNEQRRFVEIDPPDNLFELALSTIAEAPPTPQPARTSSESRAPSIQIHQSLWPAFDRGEDEENMFPFAASSNHGHHQQKQQPTHTPSRTPLGVSPFSSRSNLTIHTSHNHSSTSLSSFTPFSSTDYNRIQRPGSIHKGPSSGDGSKPHSHSNSPYGSTPAGSGPASIMTSRSVSLRSNGHNEPSDEYEGDSVDDHGHALHLSARRERDRSATVSALSRLPHYLKTSDMPQQTQPRAPSRNDAWLRESLSSMSPVPGPAKSSKVAVASSTSLKSKDKDSKSKEGKSKEGKIRYETYLDMSGDENSSGAAKKRRWLFGK